MLGIEIQLHQVARAASPDSLLPPSIAAAAIGVLLPLVRPTASTVGWKKRADEWTVAVALVTLGAAFYVWHMLVAANLGAAVHAWLPDWNLLALGRNGTLAMLIYGIAALLSEAEMHFE